MTAVYDLEQLRTLTDRVDTKYGDDDVVAALVGSIDELVELLSSGRGEIDVQVDADKPAAIRRHAKGGSGRSGYRNVYWHPKNAKWEGRIVKTVKGKRKFYYAGYFKNPKHASEAVEELREKIRKGLVE